MKRKLGLTFAFILTICLSMYIGTILFYDRLPSAKDRAMEVIHSAAKKNSDIDLNLFHSVGLHSKEPNIPHSAASPLPVSTTTPMNHLPLWLATPVSSTSIQDNDKLVAHVDPGLNGCPLKKVELSQTDLPLTALASFEGSGNTWARHLLQQATGVATSSIYCDEELLAYGFPYECEKDYRKSLVVKTHLGKDDPAMRYSRAIVIIRNPFEVILSTFHGRTGHLNHMEKKWFYSNTWKRHQRDAHFYWFNVTRYWLEDFQGPVYPLFYNNLVSNITHELQNILHFLNIPVSEKQLHCAVVNQEGLFHRQPTEYTANDIRELMDKAEIKATSIDLKRISLILKHKYKVFWDG